MIYIAAGGIYNYVDSPMTMIPLGGGRYSSVDPRAGEQTLNESQMNMVLTLSMFAGMYIASRSATLTHDAKKATTYLVVGMALILLGLAGNHYLLILKKAALG
ncbi:MAG TPA: hypothetical protein VM050_02730 [Patescibacteria group bacterium]|nr:hypothetical protein [Patescibacteria group bacterium]